jgi:hypothetical protein
MKSIQRLCRKIHIVLSHFRVRRVVADRHPDGSPSLIIKYRGAEKYIREVPDRTAKNKLLK